MRVIEGRDLEQLEKDQVLYQRFSVRRAQMNCRYLMKEDRDDKPLFTLQKLYGSEP